MYRAVTKYNLIIKDTMHKPLKDHWCTVVSRYFQHFFLKIDVCLEPFCSSFNMFLFLFCRKGVHNQNVEGSWNLVKRRPTKAIDGPSFYRRTIDGDRRLKVHAFGETRGNMTKCGLRKDWRSVDWSMNCSVESSLVSEIVPVPEDEESVSIEWQKS